MVTTNHCSENTLLTLLRDNVSHDENETLVHVESCAQCQEKLDVLSRGEMTWSEVSTLFAGVGESDPFAVHKANGLDRDDVRFLEPSEYPESLGRFARYEVMEILGRGGMGVVLRGYDPSLNRHSAVKVLAPELASSAAARRRFSREARSAAAVVHAHVVPIYTVDESAGLPYLVMPVLEGNSVDARVRKFGPLKVIEVVRVAAQVAAGLAAAHEQGLVHRDIKPANILLGTGVERVQITDFGLARAFDDANLTHTGVIAGTPQYMSPEQAHGDSIDHRSDLFSLGSLMYFMLSGRSPFRAETTMGVLNRIGNDEPRSIRCINEDVPAWLERIVNRLLQKRPGERFQSAVEVAELLERWLAHLQQPLLIDAPEREPSRDRRLQFAFLATLAIMAAVVAGGWFRDSGSPSKDGNNELRNADPSRMLTSTTDEKDWEPPLTGLKSGQKVLWKADLGSTTMRAPVVAGDQVYVGTNNAHGYLKRYPASVDLGVLLCFRESDGEFLWQHSNEKTRTGREHDWPFMGVTSRPCVQGDRLWYVTNRAEIVCLDTKGFRDGKNDGVVQDEPNSEDQHEADVIWRLDMMKELGVRPHNVSTCTIAVWRDRIFAVTGNGVGATHLPPIAIAPSFIAVDKTTGRVIWRDNSPGQNVMHGQWGSPTIVEAPGVETQVVFPGGDGWLYSFDPMGAGKGKSKLIWKYDCNSKTSIWALGGLGKRNNLLHGPTHLDGLLYIATGQDPEHGAGPGSVICLSADGSGDVSPDLVFNKERPDRQIPHRRIQACNAELGDFVRPNPQSKNVWHFAQHDVDGDGEFEIEEQMSRSLSTIAIKDGLLFVSDVEGILHCLDQKTGTQHWGYDCFATVYSTPVIVGDEVHLGTEDGEILVFNCSADIDVAAPDGEPIQRIQCNSSVNASVVADGSRLFFTTKNELIVVGNDADEGKP